MTVDAEGEARILVPEAGRDTADVDASGDQRGYQCYRSGGGRLWVRRPRGGWRTISFDSGPTALSKLLGLASVLGRLGGATTVPLARSLLVAQVAPGPDVGTPAAPRDGPAASPIASQAP